MKKSHRTLRLGTRGSPLALRQAEEVRQKISALHAEVAIEVVPIRTHGDWQPGQKDRSFIDSGGNKGMFTKEIEDSLKSGAIDIAVHSMKDVASRLPDGLVIAAILERADPREAFISKKSRTLDDLPPNSTVGTSSVRRQAQILARRPDLRVVPLRGNVDTRLRKLDEGAADATLLAVAGLVRLGVADRITSIIETDVILPSGAQGALGIEIREKDDALRTLLQALNHAPTSTCVRAERAFLEMLDASCQTPIGALARLQGDAITLEGLAARPDGSELLRMNETGPARDPETLGASLGKKVKANLPQDFFTA
ncbi:MAG: hydroxymethylbilane synthase [Alphaproteobacteria bacterium]|nr:hydroxymethylbilane synthase [Alphaproteobacteria bacterium]